MNWARRLNRVFGIEIEQCARCGGRLKVIASIEEPQLIERILAHRRERGEEAAPTASLGARAPPQASLFWIRLIVDGLVLLRRGRWAVLRAARRGPPIGSADALKSAAAT